MSGFIFVKDMGRIDASNIARATWGRHYRLIRMDGLRPYIDQMLTLYMEGGDVISIADRRPQGSDPYKAYRDLIEVRPDLSL